MLHELLDEIRTVVLGSRGVLDVVVPPILFLILLVGPGFSYAVVGALTLSLAIVVWRLARRGPIRAALGGVAGVLLATGLARIAESQAGFFLPGMISGFVTVVVAISSNLLGRPLVAWTSHVARRWPRSWYWHPRVRPAYSEVTWLWAAYFSLRLALQVALYLGESVESLAVVGLVMGWPATLVLLVVSYLYGTWRLRRLGGPSVDEFRQQADPPWESQQRGF